MKFCFLVLSFFLIEQVAFAQPTITSFSPTSGPIGTTVTITGTNFDATPANNIVFFGAVRAAVSAASATSLTVTVPIGATYQPVTVTINNLTAYSSQQFIVTFTGGGGAFTSNSFIPRVDDTVGVYPHFVSFADFNLDGKADLLICKGSSNTVSILPNTSSGGSVSFASQLDFPTFGPNHEGAATGDLDGDGKLDFVITNSNSANSVSVYKNISVGNSISFAAKVDFPSGINPSSVAIGDLNGDGKPDLATTNNASNQLSVYPNTSTVGNISFGTRIDFTVGNNPYSVAIGDLDADGKADLALTTAGSSSSGLFVIKNTTISGILSFNAPVNCATFGGSFVAVVSTGDLDGDGLPDLAATSSFSHSVVVVRNTSTPGNLSFSLQQSFITGNYPMCLSISDLTGDGKPDIATVNNFGYSISALRNTSISGNISFDTHIDYPVDVYLYPYYIASGDLDGDGRSDIVTANSSSPTVSVLQNIIGANVAPAISSFTPTFGISGTSVVITGSNFTGATSVKLGGVEVSSFTIDSPTNITAIAGAGASGDLSVTTGYGIATLPGFIFNGPIITSFTPTVGVMGTIVTITGSNFTGATDVKFGEIAAQSFTVNSPTQITATVATGSSGNVAVATGNGIAILPGFSFGVPTITSFTPNSGNVGSTVTITGTNFNPVSSDNIVFFGAVKATVSSATSTQLTVTVPAGASYQPISVTTNRLTGYSSGAFIVTFPTNVPHITNTSFTHAGNYGTGAVPVDIKMADLNNDGKPDLITVNSTYGTNSISILKNTSNSGAVSFAPKADLTTGLYPKRLAIGDLDGDGKPDIVTSNFNNGAASTISVFNNISSGGIISFSPKTDYNSGDGSIGLYIADMNLDGKPDIVVSSGNSGAILVFKNTTTATGSISFAPRQDFISLYHPNQITIADIDKDGKPDIVTANFDNSTISVFRNTSTGGAISLASKIDYSVGTYPSYVTSGDLNGDGKFDIAVPTYSSGSGIISFFKNFSTSGSISLGTREDYSLGVSNIEIADLNGDGKPDLCMGRNLTGYISVQENTSPVSGSFSFGNLLTFFTGNNDTYVASGDLNGDGKPDVAVVHPTQSKVVILRNKIGDLVGQICPLIGITAFTSNITGSNYQWQQSTDSINFNNISNNSNYSGTSTNTLQLINIPSSWSGYKYRCVVSGVNSDVFSLQVVNIWNPINTSWADPANWSCGTVPDANTDVYINSGTVIISSSTTIRSLTVAPGATVTINPGVILTILH